jgi:hypothetical protein
MKVGILGSKHETFINDVISNLSGVEVSFLNCPVEEATKRPEVGKGGGGFGLP